jgi:hypothetical protein
MFPRRNSLFQESNNFGFIIKAADPGQPFLFSEKSVLIFYRHIPETILIAHGSVWLFLLFHNYHQLISQKKAKCWIEMRNLS